MNTMKSSSVGRIILLALVVTIFLQLHQPNMPISKDCSPGEVPALAVEAQHNNNNETRMCHKYIVLTAQRSGSTWTCELLDKQTGVSCGAKKKGNKTQSELLISYSFVANKSEVEWSTYKASLDDAFRGAGELNDHCQMPSFVGEAAIGFKLMYDQIPIQFVEDGRLQKFLADNHVSIIHLVREAAILKIASRFNNAKQIGKLKAMHVTDEALAAEFRQAQKMPWAVATIDGVLQREEEIAYWDRAVHFEPNLNDHYLTYETLLDRSRRIVQLAQVMSFLFPHASPTLESIKDDTTLLQLHEPACSSRVANYTAFRSNPRISRTRTAAACDLLEKYHANQDQDNNRAV